jgi:hypothetical protein
VSKLREAAQDQTCVACGSREGVVLCHYTGARRLSYGGGYGLKAHDLCGAHLCAKDHLLMDTLSRDKSKKWEHSELFLHYIMQTIIRLHGQGVIKC